MTVVDSAGRLQIPKDLRHQFRIRHRVRLDATLDGVFVRSGEREHVETAQDVLDRMERNKRARRWGRIKRLFCRDDQPGDEE